MALILNIRMVLNIPIWVPVVMGLDNMERMDLTYMVMEVWAQVVNTVLTAKVIIFKIIHAI
jgi:hypothetical protein